MRKNSKLFSFGELVLAGIAGYIFYKYNKMAMTKVQEAVDDICPDFIDIDLGYRDDDDEEEEEILPLSCRSDAIHAIRELGKSASNSHWSSDKRKLADDIYEIGHQYRNVYGVSSVALSELSKIRKEMYWSSDKSHIDELIRKIVLV